MARRWIGADIALLLSVALLGGCNEHKRSKASRMEDRGTPSWKADYDAQEQAMVVRMRELMATKPTYPQPPADPGIYWRSSLDNHIKLVERATGNFLRLGGSNRERNLISFQWTTSNGELVCTFWVDIGRAIPGSPGIVPLRLYRISDRVRQTPELAALRQQMSLQRLAQFLTAWPGFDNHGRRFVLIDAPAEHGERFDYSLGGLEG